VTRAEPCSTIRDLRASRQIYSALALAFRSYCAVDRPVRRPRTEIGCVGHSWPRHTHVRVAVYTPSASVVAKRFRVGRRGVREGHSLYFLCQRVCAESARALGACDHVRQRKAQPPFWGALPLRHPFSRIGERLAVCDGSTCPTAILGCLEAPHFESWRAIGHV
jgi:hypothetical protein